jgi:hypothetical protein
MSDATPATSKEQQRPSFWGRGAYELFLETEGIPVYTGVAVDDLRKAELAKWPRLDARGAYVRLIGAEDTDNAYIIELEATKSSAPEKHLFEEYFFVLNGRGTCEVWNEGETPRASNGRRAVSSPCRSTRSTACTTDPARSPRAFSR